MPRHLAAVRPGSRSTVLEVDPQIPELGRESLGLVTGDELAVEVGDARTLIAEQRTDAYDVVVGDAFGSLAVPWHLTTTQMVDQVQRVLRPGGVYVLNVIDLPPLSFARAEAATLLACFEDVALLAPPEVVEGADGGNLVLVASDEALPLEELAGRAGSGDEPWSAVGRQAAERFAADAQVLTDDDAPVDQLLTTPT